MPLYLYNCRHCGHKFELLRGMHAKDSEVACPECGTREPAKILMPFNRADGWPRVGIRFG